nr:4-(cytidine 5'-diphospho)-2-C-methyl-D-erythritol kinase [Amylibacter sp.]
MIKQIARAKINLCLHVTGQRDDGYHLLDSIVGFAEYGDVLTFAPAESVSLSISGPFGAGLSGADDNLILKAARCFGKTAGQGAAIHLEKNLPVASGIGGGSADAAATLHGLSELWGLPLPDAAKQLTLGADVPVCVSGKTVRMRGIGEVIEPLPNPPDLPVVLVNPNRSVATPDVFKALAHKDNPAISGQDAADWTGWLTAQRNDLQEPAIVCVPEISNVLDALSNTGALLCRMSGSGATCFGLFDSAESATAAADQLAKNYPDWWVQTTRLTT